MENIEGKLYCKVCGNVDGIYDENSEAIHSRNPKHICNVILANYKENKRFFSKNREGIYITCNAETKPYEDAPITKKEKCDHHKIRIYAKPNQFVKYTFNVYNDMKKEHILVVGIQLAHPQPQFNMYEHPYIFGEAPHILKMKSSIDNEVQVIFSAADIGQYEMPIMFTFHRQSDKKNIIFIREMVVMVQEKLQVNEPNRSPFRNEDWGPVEHFIKSRDHVLYQNEFKIPKLLKSLFGNIGLDEDELEKLKVSPELRDQLRAVLIPTRDMFDEGLNVENYRMYFHHLLWWEEVRARINLKKYNMSNVTINLYADDSLWLEVPGLAEKRPSLLRGDKVFIRPHDHPKFLFESIIEKMSESSIQLSKLDDTFYDHYSPDALFYIRFLMSRVPMERMHEAVSRVFRSKQDCCVFPVPNMKRVSAQPIMTFFNQRIKDNFEQRSAVEHIVAKTSGTAPYIVFGPPGTGKTMTIVEAILQIVVKNKNHRVLVCTDSNMAADHIAVTLLNFNKDLNIRNLLFRACSRNREWSIMPSVLHPFSNGESHETFFSVDNQYAANFRILVTTLLHAAKFGSSPNQASQKLVMTHLFIDEAAQAKEPAALVPITGLLVPNGQLVLAGDPQQLGPVCMSKEADKRGLGKSLLERLWMNYEHLYRDNSSYITTLVQNFRSDPDILQISNKLFYEDRLQAKAPPDPLSTVSILNKPGGERAVVFHAVNSREQKMGNAPSYFNELELAMLQRYTKALINNHQTSAKDIGIIAPYIRQVYKMKDWLKQNGYDEIEIGTVESFQGKEKRVILVSTVRANCRLLDYDAKYNLGFLVDDKRFNVALTRAKAKLIIIGNPTCLTRDIKWREYMDLCKDYDTYFGQDTEQMERTSSLLIDIARTKFNRCRLTEALDLAIKEHAAGKGKTKKNKKRKHKVVNAIYNQ